jgi:hypothetical protein
MKQLILIMLIFSSISACKKDEDIPNASLYGAWESTIKGNPKGEYKYILELDPDGTFYHKQTAIGIYENQPLKDTSAWSEYRGKLKISGDEIEFLIKDYKYFDPFFWGPNVNTHHYGQEISLYQGSRFEIKGNQLTITYSSDIVGDVPKLFFIKRDRD